MAMPDHMYSPNKAVYGYDRTHVKRMTLNEYLQELLDEERDVRGEAQQSPATVADRCGVPRQFELRRAALSSPNPAITFTNKYPTYDRLGRELCVLYQLQEAAVAEELRRLRTASDATGRRSGVRLSGEVAVAEDRTRQSISCHSDGSVHTTQLGSLSPLTTRRRARSLPTTIDMLHISDFVSKATSAAASSMLPLPPPSTSRQASVAVSEFTIYRDSGFAGRASTRGVLARGPDGVQVTRRAKSTTPPHPYATLRLPSRTHACSAPPCEEKENTAFHFIERRASEQTGRKRARAVEEKTDKWNDTDVVMHVQAGAVAQSVPRFSHVHFIDTGEQACRLGVVALHGDAGAIRERAALHAALPTPHEPPRDQGEDIVSTGQQDPLRFTTVRESAMRTTKQLFCGTTPILYTTRATTTLHYAQPIPSVAYGLHAITIPASRVCGLVEDNLRSLTELGVVSIVDCASQPCPELQCSEHPVQLGSRWLRLLRFHVVAEVFEAIEEESSTRKSDNVSSAAPRVLVYRWHNRLLPFHGSETRRAALGLTLCAPAVHVSGLVFADGGVTLCTLPQGYWAVPMSSIPLSLPAFTTLLKLVLKTFSTLVARRTVHGNVTAFGELFLAFILTDGAPDLGPGTAPTAAPPPLVLPLHWERMVDFGMFADRDVGRTVAFDAEDGVEPSLLTIGRDLSTLMQCFLEHKVSAELSAAQYALLHRLILMATEHTQVANYLVQIKDLMCALPTDLPALRQACNRALATQQSKSS